LAPTRVLGRFRFTRTFCPLMETLDKRMPLWFSVVRHDISRSKIAWFRRRRAGSRSRDVDGMAIRVRSSASTFIECYERILGFVRCCLD